MVEQPDAQELSRFSQSCGQRPILRAWRGISGRMIVHGNDRSRVEEDRGFEHFPRVHNAEGERPDRDNVHADAGVLGIETTDLSHESWAIRSLLFEIQLEEVCRVLLEQSRCFKPET